MKLYVSISEEEKKKTIGLLTVDPCAYINCDNIKCEHCPLCEAADNFRRAEEVLEGIIRDLKIANE